MFLRELLVGLVVTTLAIPAPSATVPILAEAGPNRNALINGTNLRAGASVFTGDVVDVGASGDAALSFGPGSMVRLSEETTLRLAKGDHRVAIELVRGRVSFWSSQDLPVEAHLADANIHSANGLAAAGVLAFRTPRRVVVTAEKGSLLISTAHDARSVSLRAGESVELRIDAPPQGGGDSRVTSASAPSVKNSQWKIAAVVAGAILLGVGIAVARGGPNLSDARKQTLVGPFQFPPH